MSHLAFHERLRAGEYVKGTFLNLGSSLTAEIAGQAGFDWAILDLEHGSGDYQALIGQMQALASTPTTPLVRVTWNEAWMVKRALDAGARGIMIPYVNTAEEARKAVQAMRYPPLGVRGVAGYNRACQFGPGFEAHFNSANSTLVTIVQIETAQAVENVEEIASVEGVDLLFVGPADLSVGLGIPRQFDHQLYRDAVKRVAAASRAAGCHTGTLIGGPEQLPRTLEDGYTFVGIGSDSAACCSGLRAWSQAFDQATQKHAKAQ